MLRVYVVQQWFNLSDPGEKASYESADTHGKPKIWINESVLRQPADQILAAFLGRA